MLSCSQTILESLYLTEAQKGPGTPAHSHFREKLFGKTHIDYSQILMLIFTVRNVVRERALLFNIYE